MDQEDKKLYLTKELNARLLVAMSKGYIDLHEFPEIKENVYETGFKFNFPSASMELSDEQGDRKLHLTKDLKSRLLIAVSKGYINLDEFPEIKTVMNQGKTGYWFLPYIPEVDNER